MSKKSKKPSWSLEAKRPIDSLISVELTSDDRSRRPLFAETKRVLTTPMSLTIRLLDANGDGYTVDIADIDQRKVTVTEIDHKTKTH